MNATKAAFPVLELGGQGLECTDTGMTLRDYIAVHVLPTMINLSRNDGDGSWTFDNAAQGAYEMADAMLEAREAK